MRLLETSRLSSLWRVLAESCGPCGVRWRMSDGCSTGSRKDWGPRWPRIGRARRVRDPNPGPPLCTTVHGPRPALAARLARQRPPRPGRKWRRRQGRGPLVRGVGSGNRRLSRCGASARRDVPRSSRSNDVSFVLILSDAPGPQAEALRTALAATSPLSFIMAGDGMALMPAASTLPAATNRSASPAGGFGWHLRLGSTSGWRFRLWLTSGWHLLTACHSIVFRVPRLDYAERAIAVVLAGPGSDGALGVRAIKDLGGATLAQDPDTATPRGMPEGAVATGLIDRVLDPGDLAARVLDFAVDRGVRLATLVLSPSRRRSLSQPIALRKARTRLTSSRRDRQLAMPDCWHRGGMDGPTRACPRAHDSRSIAIRAPAHLGSAVRNRCRCVLDLAAGGSDPRGPRPEPRSQDSGYRPRRTRPTHRAGRPLPRNSAGRSLGRAVPEPDPRRRSLSSGVDCCGTL